MTTILLAEDAENLAAIVTRELRANGYEVIRAADGATALELHRSHQPDLVVLDWILPGLDGLAVLRALRLEAATPVLMLPLGPRRSTGCWGSRSAPTIT
jgi:DNA-binding response OmpR family regulator